MAKSKSYMAAYRKVGGSVLGGRIMSNDGDAEDAAIKKMSDAQLGYEIWNAQDEVDSIGSEMVELSFRIDQAKSSPREGREGRMEAAQDAFFEAQDRYNAARERLDKLMRERSRRPNEDLRTLTGRRVNGYGEATSRNITSQSYESSQRRLDRQVASWMRW